MKKDVSMLKMAAMLEMIAGFAFLVAGIISMCCGRQTLGWIFLPVGSGLFCVSIAMRGRYAALSKKEAGKKDDREA